MRIFRSCIAFSVVFTAAALAAFSAVVDFHGGLQERGKPVNGTRLMEFKVFDTALDGNSLWSSGPVSVSVSSGAFGRKIEPPVDFTEKARWLEPYCAAHTLGFCPRRQIEWFGPTRGT